MRAPEASVPIAGSCTVACNFACQGRQQSAQEQISCYRRAQTFGDKLPASSTGLIVVHVYRSASMAQFGNLVRLRAGARCRHVVRRSEPAQRGPTNSPSSAGDQPKDTPDAFQKVEGLIIRNANKNGPEGRSDWQKVEDCWVLGPPKEAGPPEAVVMFVGGAFVGAAPQVTYRLLLEKLAARNILVRPLRICSRPLRRPLSSNSSSCVACSRVLHPCRVSRRACGLRVACTHVRDARRSWPCRTRRASTTRESPTMCSSR